MLLLCYHCYHWFGLNGTSQKWEFSFLRKIVYHFRDIRQNAIKMQIVLKTEFLILRINDLMVSGGATKSTIFKHLWVH
jgi:hypothetical protein